MMREDRDNNEMRVWRLLFRWSPIVSASVSIGVGRDEHVKLVWAVSGQCSSIVDFVDCFLFLVSSACVCCTSEGLTLNMVDFVLVGKFV